MRRGNANLRGPARALWHGEIRMRIWPHGCSRRRCCPGRSTHEARRTRSRRGRTVKPGD